MLCTPDRNIVNILFDIWRDEARQNTHDVTIKTQFVEPALPALNPLTPNRPYRGRTTPLTSEVAFYVFIQQI